LKTLHLFMHTLDVITDQNTKRKYTIITKTLIVQEK